MEQITLSSNKLCVSFKEDNPFKWISSKPGGSMFSVNVSYCFLIMDVTVRGKIGISSTNKSNMYFRLRRKKNFVSDVEFGPDKKEFA